MSKVRKIDGFGLGDVVYFDYDDRDGYGIISGLDSDCRGEVFLIGELRNKGHGSGEYWSSTLHEKFGHGYIRGSSYWNVPTRYMRLSSNKIKK